jgi:POT family proton-dependent oligopeptide transporter
MSEHEANVAAVHQDTTPFKRQSQDMAGAPLSTARNESLALDEKKEASINSADTDEITAEDRATLRKVADKLPLSAFYVAVVELCERFAFYGLTGPFQNYIQNGPHDARPGAIGLGQSHATGLNLFFQFWCYVTPIFGAIMADQYLGKYKAIVIFSLVYMFGLLILFLTSLPVAIEHGASLGGLVTAMIIIGIGTGGIKSNVSPLIAEQYQAKKPFIKTLKNGERVIVDPAVTIQRIYMIFYLCINLGSLSAIATTEMELHIGFWSAYLLPLCMFVVGFIILILGKNKYVARPPKGSVVLQAFKAMWIALKNKGNLEAAKPSYQQEHGLTAKTPWNDLFIDELRRALVACRVFLFFPIYWVTYNQMLNNFISQAGTMDTHGIPNDLMQNIDPIAIILFIPVFDRLIYPGLRKIGIPFRPITRIAWGFIFGALAMAYAAIVQHIIYKSPPCYSSPLSSDCMGGLVPNQVHVAVQTPAYVLIAISEIFASITGLEYAFTKAPPSMKSFIMSIFLFQSALGSALGEALIPTAVDPKLLWMYTGLAVAAFIVGIIFWFMFKKYNDTEEEMNELDRFDDQVAVPASETLRSKSVSA